MAIGSGLSAQFGFVGESSYGTYTVPTRFLEFTGESLKNAPGKIYGRGIGRSRFQRKDRVRTYSKGAAGDVEFDVMTTGAGLLFKHMLGKLTVAQVAATTEYTHTAEPNPAGMAGLSATLQVGRPANDGTVHPFSYPGAKCTEWVMDVEVDKPLHVKTSWDAKREDVAQGLAAASYASDGTRLTFLDAALTLDGTTASIKKCSISGKIAQDVGRRFIGNGKLEPIDNGEFEITGQLDTEFESLALYNKFLAGTTAKLVLTFSYGTITGASTPYKLVVTIECLEYTGDTPNVSGDDVVSQSLPFKALYDGTNPLIKLVYHTSDAAA